MSKMLVSMFLVTTFTAANFAFAHSDHHHPPKKPVTAEVAKTKAKEGIAQLIKMKKIDKSWTKADLLGVEKRKFAEKEEWVATFHNKTVKDAAKQKLYVFMKLSGDFIAANYTGK
jgi:hypothetical protein